MRTVTVTIIKSSEIENLVKQHINTNFQYIQYEICGTDGAYLCEDIDGDNDSFNPHDIKNMRTKEWCKVDIYTLLSYFCSLGIIPTGNYLIEE